MKTKIEQLRDMLEACLGSMALTAIRPHSVDDRIVESVILAVVEQGMGRIINDFKALLQYTDWKNLHTTNVQSLTVEAANLHGIDITRIDTWLGRIGTLHNTTDNSDKPKFLAYTLLKTVEAVQNVELVQDLQVARCSEWYFSFVLYILKEMGTLTPHWFRIWEVGLLNQVTPGTGGPAVRERPKPEADVEKQLATAGRRAQRSNTNPRAGQATRTAKLRSRASATLESLLPQVDRDRSSAILVRHC